jgi:hypothetical protein
MALVARNGVWLTRTGILPDGAGRLPAGMDVSGVVQAIADGNIRFASSNNVQLYSAASNITLGCSGLPDVLRVEAGRVDAAALRVRDGSLGLAGSNGSGIALDSTDGIATERHVRWRASAEGPCWEMAGGGLRLTASPNPSSSSGRSVSFGMRINDAEELEFYKRTHDATTGSTSYRRLMTLGRADEDLDLTDSSMLTRSVFAAWGGESGSWHGANSNFSSHTSAAPDSPALRPVHAAAPARPRDATADILVRRW